MKKTTETVPAAELCKPRTWMTSITADSGAYSLEQIGCGKGHDEVVL